MADRQPKIHYAGSLTAGRLRVLAGWAACCSGAKAEKIRRGRQNTYDPALVTCAACRRLMDRAGIVVGKEEPGHD